MKELDRETVRQLLYNLFCSTETLDEDEIAHEWAKILGDPADLASGETQRLIQDILEEEIRQIQYNSIDFGGRGDRDSAVEQYLDPRQSYDDFVLKVMEGLEKAGKLTFKDPKTFLTNPQMPYSTYKQVKEEVFRSMSGPVWWLDKHFGPDGLMYLLDFDPKKVIEIKILCGPVNVDNKFKKDYLLAVEEFKGKNINLQARVVLERCLLQDMHDRYLADDNAAYSMPSVNILTVKWATVSKLPTISTRLPSAPVLDGHGVHTWFTEETGRAGRLSGLCEVLVGGSEWVSNPPWTLEVPINGFEVREAHRSLLAPS